MFPYGHPFNRRHNYFAAHQGPTYGYPTGNPFTASPPAAPTDLEEEERIAIAHLASIQHRREQAEGGAAREAAVRARIQAEREAREAAIRSEIERELAQHQRELAIAQAQRQRELALAQAERHRELVLAQAERQREQAQQQREQAQQQREIALAHAHHQREIALATAANARRQHAASARQARCEHMRRHSERRATRNESGNDNFEGLNGLLGALLGINISRVPNEANAQPAAPATAAAPAAPAPAAESAPSAPTPPTAAAPQETDQPAFPEEINGLLSQFLGLRVEPVASASDATTLNSAQGQGVPRGLNEFLSRFGLEFEPLDIEKEAAKEKKAEAGPASPASEPTAPKDDTVKEKKVEFAFELASTPVEKQTGETPAAPTAETAAPEPKPTAGTPAPKTDKREAPLTSFSNEFTDIPPFVRDILSNVEVALAEGAHRNKHHHRNQQGPDKKEKGKGVAEGEKTTHAAPASEGTPAAASAKTPAPLDTLNHIATELSALQSSFTFPSRLAFSSAASQEVAPPLIFNRRNSVYHAQAHKLLQLLLQADSVSSGGDKEVRRHRKEVVRDVEGAIEDLEKKRDALWLEVKQKREKGEVESEDDEGHSSGSSTVDTEENHTATAVDAATHPASVVENAGPTPAVEEKQSEPVAEVKEAEGFEVPEVQHVEESAPVEEKSEEPTETEKVAEAEHTAEAEKNEEKDEGYELI